MKYIYTTFYNLSQLFTWFTFLRFHRLKVVMRNVGPYVLTGSKRPVQPTLRDNSGG